MRKIINGQMKFGEIDISEIKFDPRSRDEIPKLLMGLQYIYCNTELRDKVFKVIERIIPEDVDMENGREGMDIWKILVLGTVRLNCNWDFDKLKEMADQHISIRKMLGHGIFDEETTYPMQTIRDNVSLLTPEVLDEINQIVVKTGHSLLKKKEKENISVRVDSFVVETDVHYPTDINLLWDAARKVIQLTARACNEVEWPGWRKWEQNLKSIKNLYRRVQKIQHSSSKNPSKKEQIKRKIIKAHKKYMDAVIPLFYRAAADIQNMLTEKLIDNEAYEEINRYISHGERQLSQIERRIVNGEVIPHEEKVFSLFQEHTEWISKGKAGILAELGLNVCICEDNFGFILTHIVMEKLTDEKVTVPILKMAQERYDDINGCSFDAGFYSPCNARQLKKMCKNVILPKKGKLSVSEREYVNTDEYIQGRRKHAAVESGINALENHGLDRCCDHGIDGFRRYVALAVVSRNIQKLGDIIQQRELERIKRAALKRRRYRMAA